MTLGCNALQCIFHASFTPAERKAWVQAVQPSAEHCAGSEDGFSFCSSGPQYASRALGQTGFWARRQRMMRHAACL